MPVSQRAEAPGPHGCGPKPDITRRGVICTGDLVKYSCADLNTEDVRAGKSQRDCISKACPRPVGHVVGFGGKGSQHVRVQDRYPGLGLTV